MTRLDSIRQSVASGSYQVPAEDVAEAVVAFFRREPTAESAGNTDITPESC